MEIYDEAESVNENRADWAEIGLGAFQDAVYENRNVETRETAFKDLMCDLRHLADRYGIAWEEAVSSADENYLEELKEAPKAAFKPEQEIEP